MSDTVSRRQFLAAGTAVGAGLCGLKYMGSGERRRRLKGLKTHQLGDGLAVVHGQDAKAMTERAVQALGGMDRLVSEGDVVVVKPNMTFERAPKMAANTNPEVVAALVELCVAAGARQVKVVEHTISRNPRPAYKISGIARAAREAGADVLFVDDARFHPLRIRGEALREWPFYDEFIFADRADVLINVPATKHHSTSRLSMGMKNVLGMVGDERGLLHQDIHAKIADLNRVAMIDLTVLDAFRVMRRHGPSGNSLADVDNSTDGARRIVVGTDRVAVDAYGATLFGIQPRDVGFIREAEAAGIGSADIQLVEELTV